MKERIKNITVKQVISTILVILLVTFVMMNLGNTQVNFVFISVQMPVVILITFVFFIGYFVGRTVKKSKVCKEDKKEKKEAKLKKLEEVEEASVYEDED